MFARFCLAGKQLSHAAVPLCFAPYAEASRTRQDAQISSEAVQDHRQRQSAALAGFAPPSALLQEREAETPDGENAGRRSNGRSPHQSEPAVRVGAASRATGATPGTQPLGRRWAAAPALSLA